MKTETELNENTLKMTMTIRSKFPELIQFLNELPVAILDIKSPKIKNKGFILAGVTANVHFSFCKRYYLR